MQTFENRPVKSIKDQRFVDNDFLWFEDSYLSANVSTCMWISVGKLEFCNSSYHIYVNCGGMLHNLETYSGIWTPSDPGYDETLIGQKYAIYAINGEHFSKEEWENHPLRQEYLIKEAMKEALE